MLVKSLQALLELNEVGYLTGPRAWRKWLIWSSRGLKRSNSLPCRLMNCQHLAHEHLSVLVQRAVVTETRLRLGQAALQGGDLLGAGVVQG